MIEKNARNQFRAQIENVTNLLKENREFSIELEANLGQYINVTSSIADFEILEENLRKNRFELVVIGEFSTGKSTFINALVGRKVLPSMAQPTTATVNYIVHVSEHEDYKEEAVIFFENGDKESVPFSELSTYVTEMSEKINVVEEIKYVNIYVDSPYLEDGVVIVDTPGMQALHIKHDEITKKQIRRSNASIFLFDINRAGSRTEFEFISDVYESIDRVFFVANRCDEVNLEEQTIDEVVQSVEEKLVDNQYHNVDPKHAKVYPVSALKALAARDSNVSYKNNVWTKEELLPTSYIETFEGRLWEYLTNGEKVQELLAQPLNRIQRFYEDVIDQLENKLAAVKGQVDVDAVEQNIARIKENIETRKLALRDEKATIMRSIRDMVEQSEEKFEKKMDGLATQLQSQLTDYDDIEVFQNDFDRINERIKSRYVSEAEKFLGTIKKNVLRTVTDRIDINEQELIQSLATDGASIDVQVELRMVKKADDTEISYLRETMEQIENTIHSVREKSDVLEDEIIKAEQNEFLEQKITTAYDYYEKQRTDIHSIRNAEPYEIEKEEDRKRVGLGKVLTWIGVPEKTKKVRENNPRVERYEKDLERLNQDFNKKIEMLESQRLAVKGTSGTMQNKLEKLERQEASLRNDFNSIRDQILQRIIKNQKEEMNRINREISRAIENATIGIKQRYNEIVDMLNIDQVVSQMLDTYFQEQDQLVRDMTTELQQQQELMSKNKNEQQQIEQQLTNVKETIEKKQQEIEQLKAGTRAVVMN